MGDFISKTAALLAELLANGSVSASSVDRSSRDTQAQFTKLSDTGIIKKQRHGAGNHYRLMHPVKLQTYIDKQFPSGLIKPLQSSANRTFGVITRGDSKTVDKLGFDLIMLRGHTDLVLNGENHRLNNSDAAFLSLKLAKRSMITIQQANCRIVTVENPTVFTELNKITDLKWDIAVYTAGKISTLLLSQLQQWLSQGHQLVHFGDYDYVGLLEYARILERCPQAVLHYPTRLNGAFIEQYGNTELHEKQIAQHESLLAKLHVLPESSQKQRLETIYELLQNTAKGLEQEAFLITPNEAH